MKRVLVGLSYGLQGIGNLALALFILLSPSKHGFVVAMPLFVVSTLSLVVVWNMFVENVEPTSALGWGTCASALFIILYGILGRQAFFNIVRGYYVYENSIPLMVSSIVLVLNAVSIYGLYSMREEFEHKWQELKNSMNRDDVKSK